MAFEKKKTNVSANIVSTFATASWPFIVIVVRVFKVSNIWSWWWSCYFQKQNKTHTYIAPQIFCTQLFFLSRSLNFFSSKVQDKREGNSIVCFCLTKFNSMNNQRSIVNHQTNIFVCNQLANLTHIFHVNMWWNLYADIGVEASQSEQWNCEREK